MEELLPTLIAGVAGGRQYWVRAPQGTNLPYVVMHRISTLRGYTFQGDDGLVQYRVQIDAHGQTYASAVGVAREIVSILSGHRGGAIRGIFVDGQRDLTVADAGGVNQLFRVSTDFIVWHRE